MAEPILLPTDPTEAGRAYGSLAAPVLRDRIGRMWRVAEDSPWSLGALEDRGARFRAFVARIAPRWLDEAEAIAAAASLEATDLYVLNALPADFWDTKTGGCTSCIIAGGASATGSAMLHKNRDIINEAQDLHVRQAPDGTQLLASRDIGTLGIAHFHSHKALAGANNTGSPIPTDELRDCGLACTHLLRLVAERAGSCDEAIAILEDALAKEVAGASGAVRGMIFLFAEPTKGVVVEMTSRRLAHAEVTDGTLIRTNHFLIDQMLPYRAEPPTPNTLRRFDRAHELLNPPAGSKAAGRSRPDDLVRLSRDHHDGPDSICSEDSQHLWMTMSACTHIVHEDTLDPAARTMASVGNPRNTLCIPVPRAINGLPADCVSGELHNLARALYAREGAGDHLAAIQKEQEAAMNREYRDLAAKLHGHPPTRVRAELTQFVARCVARVRSLLKGLTA